MFKRVMIIGVLLIAVLLLAYTQGSANGGNTWFASPTGSDTAACTQAEPCSLGQAISVAQNDDTVYLKSGTYLATATLMKSLTLQGGWDGAPGGTPVIDPVQHISIIDGEDVRICVHVNGTAINTTIRGLTLTNGSAPLGGGGVYVQKGNAVIEQNIIHDNYGASYGGGVYVGANANVTIRNNQVTGNLAKYGGGGISFASDTASGSIENNLISGNVSNFGSPSYGSALMLDNAQVVVKNNRLFSNDGSSVISATGLITANYTIVNNIFAGNLSGGTNTTRLMDIYALQTVVKHNTFVGGSYAIYCAITPVITISNNIFTGQVQKSIDDGSCTGATLSGSNNLFWNNGANPIQLTNPVQGDPRFVDAAGGDYHLATGSAAIDAGLNDMAVTEDFEGDTRPVNGIADIGADERLIYSYLPFLFRP